MNARGLVLPLCCLLAFIGCGDDLAPPAVGTPEEFVFLGWRSFEAGDYSSALSLFFGALSEDVACAEAYNGLGWSWFKLRSYSSSLACFDQALSHGLRSADPIVGKIMALQGPMPFELDTTGTVHLASSLADSVFLWFTPPLYVFAHDPTVDWRDLRVVKGQSAVRKGNTENAHAQVVALGGVSLDSSSSSFARRLEAEIKRLSDETSPDSSRMILAENWRTWLETNLQDYDYELRYGSCPTARILVRGGAVQEILDAETGAPFDDDHLALLYDKTIDDLQAYAHRQLLLRSRDPQPSGVRFYVDYDPLLGYPTRIRDESWPLLIWSAYLIR
ncbi:MAG: DUF6174 domain-containing protein [Candidatus Eisenbacteria bacterium]